MVDAKYIDTFLCSKNTIWLLDQHIQRLKCAAESHYFNWDSHQFKTIYSDAIKKLDSSDYVVRFIWNLHDLSYTYESKPLDQLQSPLQLVLATDPKTDKDPFKKNDRSYWINQTARINMTTHDILSYTSEGHIIEASRFNIFLIKNNICITPPLTSGCVNGCYRQYLLQQGYMTIGTTRHPLIEDRIYLDDLKTHSLYVGNSVRGLMPALFTQ